MPSPGEHAHWAFNPASLLTRSMRQGYGCSTEDARDADCAVAHATAREARVRAR